MKPDLATVQRWAERYAVKLGITDPVKVVVAGCGCEKKTTHVHIQRSDNRGAILWAPSGRCSRYWITRAGYGWKWLIAHEVCHLRVQSHHSPYFHRHMAKLGFTPEKRLAVIAGVIRHRHAWSTPEIYSTKVSRRCYLCGASQSGEAIIKWGKISTKKEEVKGDKG